MKRIVLPLLSLAIGLQAFGQIPVQDHAAIVKARGGKWWEKMDYGPFLTGTLTVKGSKSVALKTICNELGTDQDSLTVAFDTDLLRVAAVFQGRTKRNGTPYNGAHGGTLETSDDELLYTVDLPGWAKGGTFTDPRAVKSGRVPTEWAKYRGLYRHGEDVTFHYTVGGTTVYEHSSYQDGRLLRDLNLGARTEDLLLAIHDSAELPTIAADGLSAEGKSANGKPLFLSLASGCAAKFVAIEGRLCVRFPKGAAAKACIGVSRKAQAPLGAPADLAPLLKPGQGLYPQVLTLQGQRAKDTAPYVVDDIPVPIDNPWASEMRLGGFDFFADGKTAAVCTWNGDVWIVGGIDDTLQKVTWKRFATGLYETLGLKIVDEKIYVHGRDGIFRLHDDNGDGEADRYECFNNDIMTTANFHEFAFDLKTDKAGNFYFSKAGPVKAGGKGFDTIRDHNGTVMRVTKDGSKLEVVGTGVRTPNGIGVGPNGEITSGDNEGTSVPHCRINWFKAGKFACVPDTAHGEPCDKFTPPLCWLPMEIDNSNGDQAWVPADNRWGPFGGDMLHLSYGTCFLLKVMRQDLADNQVQGGVFRIPVNFASGILRSRFNPVDGQLYVVGLQGWQTTAARLTCFQRARYTGQEVQMPKDLRFTDKGVYLTWTTPLDKESATKAANYSVARWNYVWGKAYGSGEFSVDNPEKELMEKAVNADSKGYSNRDRVWVRSATLMPDNKTVFLDIPDMKLCHQMSVRSAINAASGTALEYEVYGTVNQLVADNAAPVHPEIAKKDDFLAGLEPGLKVSIESPAGKDVLVTPNAAWDVRPNEAHSALLEAGKGLTKTVLRGFLRIKEPVTATFSAESNSQAVVRVDGNPVIQMLATVRSKPRPVKLTPGDHEIIMELESRGEGNSAITLRWSSEQFPSELIPSSILFHAPDAELAAKTQIRQGRELFAQLHCNKCHNPGTKPGEGMPELASNPPDLKEASSRFNRDWLVQWIQNPASLRPHAPMPKVVNSPEEAADIAAYLLTKGTPAPTGEAETKANPKADPKAGGVLFHQLGCVACHTRPDQEPKPASETGDGAVRISLVDVAFKYPPAALTSYLLRPAAHYPATAMPDFRLTQDEAANLAAWLRNNARQTKLNAAPLGNAERGAKLYSAQCASCHEGTQPNAGPAAIALQGKESCSKAQYDLGSPEKTALKAFLAGNVPTLALADRREAGLRAVKNLQCTACHANDAYPGRLASVHSESKNLLEHEEHVVDQSRPPLNTMAEKLREDYMLKTVSGQREKSDRPWMLMRMPGFAQEHATLAVLGLRRTQGTDSPLKEFKVDADKAAKGAALVQQYACAICHAIGDNKPTGAFEVEGINLKQTRNRLTQEYFMHWMRNPPRYWNGTKMPQYPWKGDELEQVWNWIQQP